MSKAATGGGATRRRAKARESRPSRGDPASFGDFTLAGPISDAAKLAAISLRLGGRRLRWDSAGARITNVPEANRLLTRDYRPGWEL
jgi:hypothetical protein